MFLKPNRSPIPNNTANVAESSIWKALIPCRDELPDDIDGSNDKEK